MSSVLQKRRKQQKENLQNKQKESPSSDSGNQYDESSSMTNSYYTFDNNPQFEDIPEFNVTEDIKQQQEMEALRNSNSMNGLLNSLMSAMNSNPQNGMTPMDVLNACMPSFSNQPNTCPEPQPHSHSADHPKDFVERLYVFLNKHNVLLDMFCGVILIACQFNKFVFNALLVYAALLYTTVYLFTPKETKTKSMIYRVIGITLTLFFPQFNTPGYQFFFYSVFDIFWFVLSRYFRFVLYQRLSCYFYPTYQRVYVRARSLQAMAGEKIEVYRESVTTTQLATIMGGLLLSLVLILLLSKWIHKMQEKKRLNAIIYEYLSVAKQIQKPGTKDSLLQSFLRSYEQLTETPEEQFRSQVLSLWDQNYNEIFIDKDKKTN